MAKGYKSGGRDFQKGQSANPHGRPKVPEDLKAVKVFTRTEFERRASLMIERPLSEIKSCVADDSLPAVERMLAGIVFKAVEQGDQMRLNFLLDRLIGKVPDKLESKNVHEMYAASLTTRDLILQAKEAIEFLEQSKPKAEGDDV